MIEKAAIGSGRPHGDRLVSAGKALDRRQFVQGVTAVLTGALSALNPLAALIPSRAWAVDLHALNPEQSATLLAMIHTIAPHDGLDDAAYALVVGAIDGDAAKSEEHRSQLAAGLSRLGADFDKSSEAVRVQKLQAIEASPFFQSVRIKTLMTLYSNPIAWAHFGYEGEAFSKGGYLLRGFNDLKWLPEVPPAASGPTLGEQLLPRIKALIAQAQSLEDDIRTGRGDAGRIGHTY